MNYGGYVYILTNKRNGTLYVGVSSDLVCRTAQHKEHYYPNSFSKKYQLDRLVYFETFDRIENAIRREKQLKDWDRNWKKDLIEKMNPEWDDLWDRLFETGIYEHVYEPEKINLKLVEEKQEFDPDARIFRKIFNGVSKGKKG